MVCQGVKIFVVFCILDIIVRYSILGKEESPHNFIFMFAINVAFLYLLCAYKYHTAAKILLGLYIFVRVRDLFMLLWDKHAVRKNPKKNRHQN